MKTTAEKKRILEMPTVTGEIKIFDWTLNTWNTVKIQGRETIHGKFQYISIETKDRNGQTFLLQAHEDDVEVYQNIHGLILSKKVPYRHLEILWAKYDCITEPSKVAA